MQFPYKLPLLLDGATGTNLIKCGLESGVCVEKWILDNPDILINLQTEYVNAGSDVITAPTFGANPYKLSQYELDEQTEDINKSLVLLSKKACSENTLIAGDVSPTGLFVQPFGDNSFIEIISIYRRQAKALSEYVDFFLIETMMTLSDLRAAVIAFRKTNKPIFVTITINEDGRTLSGSTALSCLITLQELGISAFGLNCSFGADKMIEIFKEIAPYAKVPLIAKPNAGLPDNNGNYNTDCRDMAKDCEKLLKNGVEIIGGCCGTDPTHIKELRKLLDNFKFNEINIEKQDTSLIFANETQVFFLEPDSIEVSEPIECKPDMSDEIMEINESSNDVLSVIINSPDDAIDFSNNAHMSNLPVMFMSNNEVALKMALMLYQGRALVDGQTFTDKDLLKKIAEKYGAVIY